MVATVDGTVQVDPVTEAQAGKQQDEEQEKKGNQLKEEGGENGRSELPLSPLYLPKFRKARNTKKTRSGVGLDLNFERIPNLPSLGQMLKQKHPRRPLLTRSLSSPSRRPSVRPIWKMFAAISMKFRHCR